MKNPHLRHLFVSPGHNFFGHYGQSASAHPIHEVSELECVVGRGIRGDRFFDYKPDYKGQITFFSWENLVSLWDALEVPEERRDPSATRRNVIVEGLDLNTLIGSDFELQGLRFHGTEESRPCFWMDGAIQPGAEAWMKGRGGLRATILRGGWLRRDQPESCPSLLGVLLAGGSSLRMGQDKAALSVDGLPLWERQLARLGACCPALAVASGSRPGWLPEGVPWIQDAPCARGPMAGLLAALEFARDSHHSHVLALAVDLPKLEVDLLCRMLRMTRLGQGVVPSSGRGPEPLCAIYPLEAYPVLRALAERGNWKLQDAIGGLLAGRRLTAFDLSASEQDTLFNLNHPSDLALLTGVSAEASDSGKGSGVGRTTDTQTSSNRT